MNITLKFKSRITTKETYPHSFLVEFVREMQIDDYKDEYELSDIIFKRAHEFEETITNSLHVVDTITECLGITFIHDIKTYQMLDLARAGFKTIRGE
ncbi:hypothetical protein J6W34_00305 [bacterium]|nr:hypothetical protein [bacterium]